MTAGTGHGKGMQTEGVCACSCINSASLVCCRYFPREFLQIVKLLRGNDKCCDWFQRLKKKLSMPSDVSHQHQHPHQHTHTHTRAHPQCKALFIMYMIKINDHMFKCIATNCIEDVLSNLKQQNMCKVCTISSMQLIYNEDLSFIKSFLQLWYCFLFFCNQIEPRLPLFLRVLHTYNRTGTMSEPIKYIPKERISFQYYFFVRFILLYEEYFLMFYCDVCLGFVDDW